MMIGHVLELRYCRVSWHGFSFQVNKLTFNVGQWLRMVLIAKLDWFLHSDFWSRSIINSEVCEYFKCIAKVSDSHIAKLEVQKLQFWAHNEITSACNRFLCESWSLNNLSLFWKLQVTTGNFQVCDTFIDRNFRFETIWITCHVSLKTL